MLGTKSWETNKMRGIGEDGTCYHVLRTTVEPVYMFTTYLKILPYPARNNMTQFSSCSTQY